jgi:hypothetical protein
VSDPTFEKVSAPLFAKIDAEYVQELAQLRTVENLTPVQLRTMAELVENVEGEAAARPVWERAAAAGDPEARRFLADLLTEESGE